MHGAFTEKEIKTIARIENRYKREVISGSRICHFGDCNIYNADFPFCDCGLICDLTPMDHSLALYLYPDFDKDFETQMETRGIVEGHFLSIKRQEVSNERQRDRSV